MQTMRGLGLVTSRDPGSPRPFIVYALFHWDIQREGGGGGEETYEVYIPYVDLIS